MRIERLQKTIQVFSDELTKFQKQTTNILDMSNEDFCSKIIGLDERLVDLDTKVGFNASINE